MAMRPDWLLCSDPALLLIWRFLDVPTQALCCRVAHCFAPPKLVTMLCDTVQDAAEAFACPDCFLHETPDPKWPTALQIARLLNRLWLLVAEPVLDLACHPTICPGLYEPRCVRVFILGWNGMHRLSREGWEGFLRDQDRPEIHQESLDSLLSVSNLPTDVPDAITVVNTPDFTIELAMTIIKAGNPSFHMFPATWEWQDEERMLPGEAVLQFQTFGIVGVIYFEDNDYF